MREANDRRKEIEKEHTETVSLLQEQQTEIQRKVATATDKSKAYESIETLQVHNRFICSTFIYVFNSSLTSSKKKIWCS